MSTALDAYFRTLGEMGSRTKATRADGSEIPVSEAVQWAVERAKSTHADGHKLVFVGNGGSAAIASHMAIDYSKNGGIRSLAFNDGASLTCLSNDLGYENVFAAPLRLHGVEGDFLIAISSSGKSANILSAVEAARERGLTVMTLSGFEPGNPLRRTGDVNFYVPSGEYGFVEISHLTICHAVLDILMGWRAGSKSAATGGTLAS